MGRLTNHKTLKALGNITRNKNPWNFQIASHPLQRLSKALHLSPRLSVAKRNRTTDHICQWGDRH